jgi:hypothetical protein
MEGKMTSILVLNSTESENKYEKVFYRLSTTKTTTTTTATKITATTDMMTGIVTSEPALKIKRNNKRIIWVCHLRNKKNYDKE